MKLIIFKDMPVEEMRRAYNQLREDGFLICNRRPEVIELTDNERIKLGELEIERPVKLISKEDMPQTASSKTLKKKGLKPITKKKISKKQKSIPRKQVKYTDEIIKRVKEVANEKSNPEIAELLRVEFGINVAVNSVANMMYMKNIKRSKIKKKLVEEPKPVEEHIEIETPEMKRKEEIAAQKRKGMSKEVVKAIRDNYMEMTDEELREEIGDKHGAFFQVDKIKAYRESNGMDRPEGWDPYDFCGDDDDN